MDLESGCAWRLEWMAATILKVVYKKRLEVGGWHSSRKGDIGITKGGKRG